MSGNRAEILAALDRHRGRVDLQIEPGRWRTYRRHVLRKAIEQTPDQLIYRCRYSGNLMMIWIENAPEAESETPTSRPAD